MTIRQVYYTSCREGLDGIQGFQVNAATPGTDRRHIDNGVQLSLYRPPPSAPSIPTADDLRRLPVAVGYRAYDDHAVVFHSRYLGADISGRQGNYFAHILVLDDPDQDLRGMLPAFAWDAERWWSQPSTTPELAPLPDVPRGRLGDWRVGDHLRAGGLADLTPLLTAVQEGLRTRSGRVVVVADPQDVARAVVAVGRSLPPRLAAAVSFTTFTAAPGDVDVLVAGTTPDVAIPASPFGDQTVLRLGAGGSGPEPSRYARVVAGCWERSDAELDRAIGLAAAVHPAVEAAELDELSHMIELVVPDGPPAQAEPLSALEFGLRRMPKALTPPVWQRVDRLVAGGPVADVERWSAVLSAARAARMTPPPGVEAAYVPSLLTAIDDGVAPDALWRPARFDGHLYDAALTWAAGRLRTTPSFVTATAVLAALGRVRIVLPEPTLCEIVDNVVLPQLIDPGTAAAAVKELDGLPAAERVLPLVCRRLDARIADDDLFDTVVEELPAAAAGLLAPHARPGTRAALAFAMVAARARVDNHRPDEVLVEALRSGPPVDAATVQRYVRLLWPDLPSIEEALALCRAVGPPLLSATTVPAWLVGRLEADAGDPGLGKHHLALAAVLGREPLRARLGAAGDVVDAIEYGAWFTSRPRFSDRALEQAVAAVRLSTAVQPEIRRWVLQSVADWILCDLDPIAQYNTMATVLADGRCPQFVGAYRQGLIGVLRVASPQQTAEILLPLAALSARESELRDLLNRTAAMVLTGRRKRDLDAVTQAIGRLDRKLRPLLKAMGRRAPKSWPIWWDEWRERHLRQSVVSRLLARLRMAKAAD